MGVYLAPPRLAMKMPALAAGIITLAISEDAKIGTVHIDCSYDGFCRRVFMRKPVKSEFSATSSAAFGTGKSPK